MPRLSRWRVSERALDDWWALAFVRAAIVLVTCAPGLVPWLAGQHPHAAHSALAHGLVALAIFTDLSAAWLLRRALPVASRRPWLLAVPFVALGTAQFAFGMALATLFPSPAAAAVLVGATTVFAHVLAGRAQRLTALASVALWMGLGTGTGEAAMMAGATGIALIATIGVALSERRDHDSRMRRARESGEQRRALGLVRMHEEMGLGWFWETNRRGELTSVSPHLCDLLGTDEAGVLRRPLGSLFAESSEGERQSGRSLNFHLSARSAFRDLPLRAAIAGEERWWAVSGQPVVDGYGNFTGFRGSGTDLTEMRRSQEEVSRLAHHDSLTGLANRLQMQRKLDRLLRQPGRADPVCTLFMIDLDRFKEVNDTLGHPAGDALLKQVAQRLERTIGQSGHVGRLGGDEFQVLLPGIEDRRSLAALAMAVIADISQPYSIDGSRVTIGASIGVALAPHDGRSSEALIRNADLALYAAKGDGRGRHRFYSADLHSDAEERRALEQDLRDAVARGELRLVYQPVIATGNRQIVAFEALLRWDHPRRGAISPARFVPIAEEAGLVGQIGEWALRTACRDLAQMPGHARVAVNVSPIQFANPGLPAVVANALASAGLAPGRLELEITESVFLDGGSDTDAMFASLKRLGVRLALDDFGTGYSSLGYLKTAPFDKIKIDQSFVRGATQAGSRNGAIIRAIVGLAEALGMDTTAEGVETLDELELVALLGCSQVQGYVFDRPLAFEDASARMLEGPVARMPVGPKASRHRRHAVLRSAIAYVDGRQLEVRLRNLSVTGALVEGLGTLAPDTRVLLDLGDGARVSAMVRWADPDRAGVAFAEPLVAATDGALLPAAAPWDSRDAFATLQPRRIAR